MKNLFCTVLFLLGASSLMAQESGDPHSKFLITGSVNYAYRLGEIPDGASDLQRDYIKKLKSGMSFDVAAYYKWDEYMGLGLKYNVFKSKGTLSGVDIEDEFGNVYFNQTVSDDITISFYGPSFIFDKEFEDLSSTLTVEAALGYMHYQNNVQEVGSFKYKGGTLATIVSLNYKFEVVDNFYVGPQFTIVSATLSEYKVTGPGGETETIQLEDENRESLWRVDLGVNLNYRF